MIVHISRAPRLMFVHEPGALLDLALDAMTLVDPAVHRAQRAENPHFSIDDRLAEITAPVLLVCGEADSTQTASLKGGGVLERGPHARGQATGDCCARNPRFPHRREGRNMTRDLLISIAPKAVAVADPNLPQGVTAEKNAPA